MAVPKYRMSERCYVKALHTQESFLHERGDEIEYSGTPGRNWIGLNEEGRAAVAAIAPLSDSAKNIAPRRGDPGP
jgi:hypothetical protein